MFSYIYNDIYIVKNFVLSIINVTECVIYIIMYHSLIFVKKFENLKIM